MRSLCLLTGLAVSGFLALGSAGCQPKDAPPQEPPPSVGAEVPPPPPPEQVVGRIALVGANEAFVVVETSPGFDLKTGEELAVRFAGRDLGRVRISPERKKRMVTADVLHGSVEKGYEVVRHPGNPLPSTLPSVPLTP